MPVELSKILSDVAKLQLDDKLAFDETNAKIVGRLGYKTVAAAKGGEVACNRDVLKIFRESLGQKYGVFGEHAFDMVLGSDLSTGKLLNVRGIHKVLDVLNNSGSENRQKLIEARFDDELDRQLEAHPQMFP